MAREITAEDDAFWKALCQAQGDWGAPGPHAMIERGYVPSIGLLALAVEQGCAKARPAFVEGALGFSVTGASPGLNDLARPHMYAQSYKQDSGRFVVSGASGWKSLLESGQSPLAPDYQACAKLLAERGGSINAKLDIEQGGLLLTELAKRGLDDLITSVEFWSGERFKIERGPKSKTPAMDKSVLGALRAGQGDIAKRMADSGAADPEAEVEFAMAGWLSPLKPPKGAFMSSSWLSGLEGLKVAARSAGFLGLAAWDDSAVQKASLANPRTVTLWLALEGARARARAAPREDLERACAKAIAQGRALRQDLPVDLERLDAPPARIQEGWLSKLWGSPSKEDKQRPAADSVKPADMWMLGRERAEALRSKTLPLGEALAACDRGDFERAREALSRVEPGSKARACVAFLGLAIFGWWDAPSAAGAEEERNPLMWAGFKLALEQAGAELSNPIPGLDGVDLMGLCAAVGRLDACSAVIEAGASLDPHPLSQGPSPLALATYYDNPETAHALLEAGASPMEGAKLGVFGWERRRWAVHAALGKKYFDLAKAMLELDPRCALLPNAQGQDVMSSARLALAGELKEEERSQWQAVAALAERSILAADLERQEPAAPKEPRRRPGL